MGLNIANIEKEQEQEFRQWCEKKGITQTEGLNQIFKEKFIEQKTEKTKEEIYVKIAKEWTEFLNDYKKLMEIIEQENMEQKNKKNKEEYQEKIEEIDDQIKKWKTQELIGEINYIEYLQKIEKIKKELIIYCKERDVRLGEMLDLSTQKKELTTT
jgi:hypothetical protein